MLHVLNVLYENFCPQCLMSSMSYVLNVAFLNVACPQCFVLNVSVLNVLCPQCPKGPDGDLLYPAFENGKIFTIETLIVQVTTSHFLCNILWSARSLRPKSLL